MHTPDKQPRSRAVLFGALALLLLVVLTVSVSLTAVDAEQGDTTNNSRHIEPTAAGPTPAEAGHPFSPSRTTHSPIITERIIKASNQRGRNHVGQILPLSEFLLPQELVEAWRVAPVGSPIVFTTPDGHEISARVTKSWEKNGRLNRVAVSSNGEKVGMTWNAKGMNALMQFPSLNLAYRIVQGARGQDALVQEWLLSDVVCSTPAGGHAAEPGQPVDSGLPLPTGHDTVNAASSSQAAASVPALQSRPGAEAVIYIDFDGETVEDPLWNDGQVIMAPPARLNAVQIREAWERVTKEFEVFDVNVTTLLEDYEAAPENRRTHCVVSSNDAAAPGAGGVAYLNSFTGVLSPICWAFIDTNPKYCADVVTHEVGHTLDLRHDGREEGENGEPAEEYYGGHGTGVTGWAPNMGVGYYKNLVQWSKGEYTRANNPEDDLAIMSDPAKIPLIADDMPDAPDGTEPVLTPGDAPVTGVIGNAASDDADVLRADLAAGSYRINMLPATHAILDAKIEVLDADQNVLATGNPPDLLTADMRFRLDSPGTVYFRASGTGKPEVESTGYSAYSSFGSYTLELASIYGDLLDTLNDPSADNFVQSLASDDAGRIYLAGNFTRVNDESRIRVARLVKGGDLDETFDPGAGPDRAVRTAVFSAREKGLYIGGDFTSVGGMPQAVLARLAVGKDDREDGDLDTDFAPLIAGSSAEASPYISAILIQDDGKVLVGGFFSSVNGQPRQNLARLYPDGSLDEKFDVPVNGSVQAIASQVDGKIFIGGSFGEVHGVERNRLARLHRNGALDQSFEVGSGPTGGFDGTVMSLATNLEGEVFVGGQFSRYNGRDFYNNLVKLQPDGRVSPKFNFTPGLSGTVRRVILRPTGQILVSGHFTKVGNNALGVASTPAGRIAQLQPDGSLDESFNPGGTGADGTVLDAIAMADGNILAAGAFTNFNESEAERLAVISGFDGVRPLITSPLWRNLDVLGAVDHVFTSSIGSGARYELLDKEGNPTTPPSGLNFDPDTGRLSGLAVEPGTFEFLVRATSDEPGEAASEDTRFVLVVNVAPVSFKRWQQAFPPPAGTEPGADLVRGPSGLTDYMIFALTGGDPAAIGPDARPLVQAEDIEGVAYLTLTASKYAYAADDAGNPLVYRVEFSDDLINWRWESPADVVVVSETATQLKARAAVPTTEVPAQFLRLKVLAP